MIKVRPPNKFVLSQFHLFSIMNKTPLSLPPIIFGTSGLGNLFTALAEEEKLNIVSECVRVSKDKVVFDSAGKYGAGLALETLGTCLKQLNIPQENVVISNKLGWLRTRLKTQEPTFEPGVWKNLKHDAVQKISYDGILECFEQGNELLGGYIPQMVSVHDPDEYINSAKDHHHAEKLYNDILEAYDALHDLKAHGEVHFIGVGAKDWKIIKRIAGDIQLDWIMIANSLTIKHHPQELLDFIAEMERKSVYVINSAVFHSGFLVGSNYFDYRLIERGTSQSDDLYKWRDHFYEKCIKFNIKPSEACVQFSLNVPGVRTIALNTTNASRVQSNLAMLNANIPSEFWQELKISDLINVDFISWLEQAATA
jgi:D-threo-aldose 1-dehydrogenase